MQLNYIQILELIISLRYIKPMKMHFQNHTAYKVPMITYLKDISKWKTIFKID